MYNYYEYRKSFENQDVTFWHVIQAYKANPVYGDGTASLAGLARSLNIPLRTVQNWSDGSRSPSKYILCLICYTLYCDGCYVLPLIV